jgi:hypothetical protein
MKAGSLVEMISRGIPNQKNILDSKKEITCSS